MQPTYSKADDTGNPGAVFCRSEAPQPLPKLPGGPAARPGAELLASRLKSFDRVLPLPPVHFDVATGTHTREPAALASYVKQVFSPLPHRHVTGDLATLLRQVADDLGRSLSRFDQPCPARVAKRPGRTALAASRRSLPISLTLPAFENVTA